MCRSQPTEPEQPRARPGGVREETREAGGDAATADGTTAGRGQWRLRPPIVPTDERHVVTTIELSLDPVFVFAVTRLGNQAQADAGVVRAAVIAAMAARRAGRRGAPAAPGPWSGP
jgi:hypothetical protein